MDGYFATKRKYFGCPKTPSVRTIRIAPFPASSVKLKHLPGDCISPDLANCDHLLTACLPGMLRYLNHRPDGPDPPSTTRMSPSSVVESSPDGTSEDGRPRVDSRHSWSTSNPADSSSSSSSTRVDAVRRCGSEGSSTGIQQQGEREEKGAKGVIMERNEGPMRSNTDAANTVSGSSKHNSGGIFAMASGWASAIPESGNHTIGGEGNAGPVAAESSNVCWDPLLPLSSLPVLSMSIPELLRVALEGGTTSRAWYLYDLGRADALRWVKLEELAACGKRHYP